MRDSVIRLDHVSKSFPIYQHVTGGFKQFLFHLPTKIRSLRSSRFEALRDLSFEVQAGEAVGIIGRNGSGKSTTLGLIAGVMRPTSGTIQVMGRVSPLLELGSGFHHELTGRENILLNGVLLGSTRAEVMAKMDDIIEFSELGDFIDQPIRVYSSGMVARLAFSVVSTLDPEILLIDEILAVGDFEFQRKCKDRMLAYKQKGVTMVFVSHSMQDVKLLCDRVVWIDDHTLKMVGATPEVADAYLASGD